MRIELASVRPRFNASIFVESTMTMQRKPPSADRSIECKNSCEIGTLYPNLRSWIGSVSKSSHGRLSRRKISMRIRSCSGMISSF